MKRISLVIVVLSLIFASNSFARVYSGTEKIYLRPSAVSWWLNDAAKVGIYFSDGTTGSFVEALWLVDNAGGNIWLANVPAGTWDRVIVTRHSASPISWENKQIQQVIYLYLTIIIILKHLQTLPLQLLGKP